MMACTRLDILAQLLQPELGLGVAGCMVKDIPQLPDNTAEAVHKPLILTFQRRNNLLVLSREIPWLLEETPTPFPYGQEYLGAPQKIASLLPQEDQGEW